MFLAKYRTWPGAGMRDNEGTDSGMGLLPNSLPTLLTPVYSLLTPPSLPSFFSSLDTTGWTALVPTPPLRPTKAQVSLQPRAGPAWLPRLLSRAFAVSLRWKEPSSWRTKTDSHHDL